MWSVYKLRCPVSGKVRYVGMAKNPVKRLYVHCHSFMSNIDMDGWIAELKRRNLSPILEIVYEFEEYSHAVITERFYIDFHIKQGDKPFNFDSHADLILGNKRTGFHHRLNNDISLIM